MPQAKAGAAAAVVGGRLVLAGGTRWQADKKYWLKRVDIYNIATGEWRSGPSLPVPLAYGAFVQSQRGLEALGGWDGQRMYKQCWTLDPGLAKWTPSGTLPENRVYGTAGILGSTLYLLGGSSDANNLARATDTVFARDGGDGSEWKKLTPMPGGPRVLHASAVARERLFVFGGCRSETNGALINLGDAYSYDPHTDRWKRLPDLPRATRSLSATAVDGRYIYLFGGYIATAEETRSKPADFGFTGSVYVYDVETERYQAAASLPIPISDVSFFLHEGALYGAGGEDRNYGRSSRTLIARLDH